MGRFLPVALAILLAIYTLVEVAQAPTYAVRRMPRWGWATAIILLPILGAAGWLFLGRPSAQSRRENSYTARPKAPDDDNDFLRGL